MKKVTINAYNHAKFLIEENQKIIDAYEGQENPKYQEVPKGMWWIHETRCCKKHGCKYGHSKCPVKLGLIEQKYPCKSCSDNKIK